MQCQVGEQLYISCKFIRNLNSDGQQFYNYQQKKHGCFILMTVQSIPLICIQQMSKHIIHLYGVFNNMINEIPAKGDNAG
jgi:hypothetical protein